MPTRTARLLQPLQRRVRQPHRSPASGRGPGAGGTPPVPTGDHCRRLSPTSAQRSSSRPAVLCTASHQRQRRRTPVRGKRPSSRPLAGGTRAAAAPAPGDSCSASGSRRAAAGHGGRCSPGAPRNSARENYSTRRDAGGRRWRCRVVAWRLR